MFRQRRTRIAITLSCVGIGVLSVLILWLAFWGVVHPIVAKLYFGPNHYTGVHYIQENNVEEFENGAVFNELIKCYGLLELGEVTEFSYYDNRCRDNPIYGKGCDIFSVSVYVQSELRYAEKKEEILAISEEKDSYHKAVCYYIWAEGNVPAVVLFCDSTRTVQLIYATTFDGSRSIIPLLLQNSSALSAYV